jgi:glycosyltransferase involved in cell wall biosynthesis
VWGGTLWKAGRFFPEALRGGYWREVMAGAWQGSRVKSALMALALRRLQRSGWLRSVRRWIAISDFMRNQLVEAGLDPESIVTLRHSWDALAEAPREAEGDHYLFLGRLVEEKGLRCLLEAWERMGERAPRLVVAGDGPMREFVEAAAARMPMVRAAGHVTGVEKTELLS